MIKKCVFGIFLAALFSCNKSEQFSKIQSAATSEVLRNTAGILKLETFDFPNDIEGCSCYFSKSKEDFDSEKYIYADDYGKKAVIKIDGKFISFPLILLISTLVLDHLLFVPKSHLLLICFYY